MGIESSKESWDLFMLGYQAHNSGKLQDSEVIYRFLNKIYPDDIDVLHLLGTNLYQLEKYDESLILLEKCLSLNPDFAEALSNYGNCLKLIGRYEEAIVVLEKSVALKPDFADPLCNLGACLYDVGRFDESEVILKKSILLNPRAESFNNLGLIVKHRNPIEALKYFSKAIEINNNYADAHWNLSLVQLMMGDYLNGWKQYEWRYAANSILWHGIAQPHWNGEDLNGKSIFIHSEQGFGDTLQFCRYLSLFEKNVKILFACPEPLVKLISYSFSNIEIVKGIPIFDHHCPLMSLPMVFNTTLESIPPSSYLRVDKQSIEKYSLPENIKKIGLVWAGGARKNMPKVHEIDKRRSMKLSQLEPLFKLPFQFHSLQKDEAAEQIKPEYNLIDRTSELTDFYETASLIMNLDLVISVDTAVAHLAAALGKPVYILSRYDACWRWLYSRTDSPWYPSVKLFKQPSPGDWDTVINDVITNLI